MRSDLLSRPSRASALARAEREPGPSAKSREAQYVSVAIRRAAPGSRVSLRSPGTRERGLERALRSLVPAEQSARACASGARHRSRACPRSAGNDASRVNPTCVDPAQRAAKRNMIRRAAPGSRVSLRSPGTRERGKRDSRLTISNSAVFSVPAARSRARVGLYPFASIPREGWAERRQAHLFCCRACEARPIRTRRGAARPMTRDARLSALHRGGFRPGAALPSPALPPDPCSELLAARSSCLAGGVPDLPSPRLRAAAAGRHSPLRLQDRL